MLALVVGGAASGKSAFAEALVLGMPGRRVYVATMEAYDAESQKRVARHRARRADYGFTTFEQPRHLSSLVMPDDANALLDCMGNLVANELYAMPFADDPRWPEAHWHEVAEHVAQDTLRLARSCANLTVVANEVCLAGTSYEGETLPYLRCLALVNRRLAARADFVCEVVAGCPNVLKGELPCV